MIRQVEAKITQVEHDKNIWSIKLKEKDQEYRLNELRIKELKRQVPHKALKPLTNSKNQKKRKQKAPFDQKLMPKGSVDENVNKSMISNQASVDLNKTDDPQIEANDISLQPDQNEGEGEDGKVFATQVNQDDEPDQSHKVDMNDNEDSKLNKMDTEKQDQKSEDDMNDDEVNNRQSDNEADKKNNDEKRKSVDESSPKVNTDQKPGRNEEPSRLSYDTNNKEGFYDNNFMNEKDDE